MAHVVLYRKWRPQTFVDLLGQDHVTKTLTNAIKNNHIAHAYLFCGPRGTGKTTAARLIAKALNCEKGVSSNPCNECMSCTSITRGASMDVIEIDAASNRGIEEIRNLREQVKFASTGSRYKVYIIDEFHMLTTEAANAFLKTLEEPPPNVIFVLATTEAHKILPTILSRCQRFDFRKISLSAILNRLNQIVVSEKIPVTEKALSAIARQAQGGMRDALSLLDQISSFSADGETVSDELVYQMLGMLKEDILLDLGNAIAENQAARVIEILNDLLNNGNDALSIVRETTNFFRDLLLIKNISKPPDELNVLISDHTKLKELSDKFSQKEIILSIELLNQTADRLRRLPLSSIWLEANMVRLCIREDLSSVEGMTNTIKNLQERIKKLESAVKDGKVVKDTRQEIRPTSRPEPRTEKEPLHTQPQPKATGRADHPVYEEPDVPEVPIFEKHASAEVKFDSNETKELNQHEIWAKLLPEVAKFNVPLQAKLLKGRMELDNDKKSAYIYFASSLWKELIEKAPKDFKLIESTLGKIVGNKVKLTLKVGEPENPEEFPPPPLFENLHAKEEQKEYKTSNNSNQYEENGYEKFNLIKESAKVFRGRIIKVKS